MICYIITSNKGAIKGPVAERAEGSPLAAFEIDWTNRSDCGVPGTYRLVPCIRNSRIFES